MRSDWATRSPALWWWGGALAMAVALKHHYSVADAPDLAWMLRPLALLLQLMTQQPFEMSARGEWQSEAAGIVLVKACAGINFMVMSFIGWCWLLRPHASRRWQSAALIEWPLLLFGALLLACISALAVNTLRVLLAINAGSWLDQLFGAGQAHRLLGLAVYLPALTLQMLLAERRARGLALLLAGATYVAVMLLIPLLTREAFRQPAMFRAHVLTVMTLVTPLMVAGLCLWHRQRTRGPAGKGASHA